MKVCIDLVSEIGTDLFMYAACKTRGSIGATAPEFGNGRSIIIYDSQRLSIHYYKKIGVSSFRCRSRDFVLR